MQKNPKDAQNYNLQYCTIQYVGKATFLEFIQPILA
jgi:hypothetical protein